MKRKIRVAKKTYSPTKAELEEPVKLPRRFVGKFDEAVKNMIRPTEIEETERGEESQ